MTSSRDEPLAFVPESFLGGSASRLQSLQLQRVPFPELPKILLSATGLVTLNISKIPRSGYILPEAMVRCLSILTKLESLSLGFDYPPSRPVQQDRRLLSPPRSILLSLTYFQFKGVSEYLEYLVARIEAPQLESLDIRFFHQLIFDTPRLAQFVARAPNIQRPVEARISFSYFDIEVTFRWTIPRAFKLVLRIRCRGSDWQLSSLTQVCSSSFPDNFISAVEHLYIFEPKYGRSGWRDDIEDSQWREVLLPFTAVKYLYISREFTSRIGPALQELAEEVLPSLQNLLLGDLRSSEPIQGPIGKFIATRQLSGQPMAVSYWNGN